MLLYTYIHITLTGIGKWKKKVVSLNVINDI